MAGSNDELLCSMRGDRARSAGQYRGVVLTMDGVVERQQILPVTADPIANIELVGRIREAMAVRMDDVDPVGAAMRTAAVADTLDQHGDGLRDMLTQMSSIEHDIDDGPAAWVQKIIDTLDAPTGTDDPFDEARVKVERVNDIAADLDDLDTENRSSRRFDGDSLAIGEILQDLRIIADDHDLETNRRRR
ncbi:hypothetical protein ASF30_12235 [Leifsonia sp. Leaf264]|nr:hypothetical protein ASF30_12235 [Leifsonia sp. Leaf264]